MSKLFMSLCLAAGIAPAANPYFGIRAIQPGADNMVSVYHTFPALTVGVRFPRTSYFALNTELTGSYAAGAGDFSQLSVWDATLRVGAEFRAIPSVGAYIMPGVMLGYASEYMPGYDTSSGVIAGQNHSGAGLGLFANLGVTLFRIGDWDFDVQGGVDVLSVPTGPAPSAIPTLGNYYYPYGTNSINLTALTLGLVARRGVAGAGRQ